MNCDKYLELLSARLDGALTGPEERELEAHLESCPACRAAEAQLAALQSAFAELEDIPAPEGFARDVMDRIREPEVNKTIPLFRRPLFKVLAGLAACTALAAGLYGTARPSRQDAHLVTRGYRQNAVEEAGDVSGFAELRSVPEVTAVYDSAAAVEAAPVSGTEILVVERMPEGGWDLIPPETPVSADGLHVTGELLEQIERLAQEQGITASITSGTEGTERHLIVVLDETK